MKVTICIGYSVGEGGSEMLCKDVDFPVAPVVGDLVETLPGDEDHRRSTRWCLHANGDVEIHIQYGSFAPGDVELLREHGYRHPHERTDS